MIVTHVTGDCPRCGAAGRFGNVFVGGTVLLRGCGACGASETVALPSLRKAVVYLDQFVFSGAQREADARFEDALARIERASSLQLLVAPYSTVHELEAHQWRDGPRLMGFIRAVSRGHRFLSDHDVLVAQILDGLARFMNAAPADSVVNRADALSSDVHHWDGYFRIDMLRYFGDIDRIRSLKARSVDSLVGLFDDWRASQTNFEDDVAQEIAAMAEGYLSVYGQYLKRLMDGDLMAEVDSPAASSVVQLMLHQLGPARPVWERFEAVKRYFASDHFARLPRVQIAARIYAALKESVRLGAYPNRDRAPQRLSGIFQDVAHIATYAPYVDAIVVDRAMHDLVRKPAVALERDFGVRVFSLTNWQELLAWLDALEGAVSAEQRSALTLAYPWLGSEPGARNCRG